jgi:hypothetical protein
MEGTHLTVIYNGKKTVDVNWQHMEVIQPLNLPTQSLGILSVVPEPQAHDADQGNKSDKGNNFG